MQQLGQPYREFLHGLLGLRSVRQSVNRVECKAIELIAGLRSVRGVSETALEELSRWKSSFLARQVKVAALH
jgi:hypothetical protein